VPPVFRQTIATEPVRTYYRSRRRPELVVVDKVRGGKADAVNAAINVARYPLVLAVDADTLIEHDALLRLARPFILDRDVAAAGATIRVANGCTVVNQCVRDARLPRNWIAGVQVPEYLRAFLFGRLGWNPLGGNLIVSGAFGIFRRDHLVAIGGYQRGSVGEDVELVVRLHRHLRRQRIPYRITFIPDPIAWTEVPSDLASLGRQRERWHRGLATTLGSNLELLFNFRYGKFGLIAFPFFVLGELLAPVVEAYGVLILLSGTALGLLDASYAMAFFAAAWGYGTLITVAAVVMEEVAFARYERFHDFVRMLAYALCEPFGFRQLTVVWRLAGLRNALLGRRDWGRMRRRGFVDAHAG
jgi:cellulose synthase/poly-beta-1,6-N-acetylglucosamine synthase-like glycosyltransferase